MLHPGGNGPSKAQKHIEGAATLEGFSMGWEHSQNPALVSRPYSADPGNLDPLAVPIANQWPGPGHCFLENIGLVQLTPVSFRLWRSVLLSKWLSYCQRSHLKSADFQISLCLLGKASPP